MATLTGVAMAAVRAYSVLEIKSVDEEQRLIEGIASTPSTDRMGDIVEPKGATFKLPIPLLWQHKSGEPIGHVIEATVTDGGIAIRAQIAKIADAGKLKDRIDEAWQSIKNRLVRGLSIGFSPIESADIKGTWGQRFTKWEWLELSAVTIPANIDASIQTIKSYDVDPSAASGTNGLVSHKPLPGVSGVTRGVRLTRKDTSMPKLIADQIKELEATRQAKAAKLEAIQAKATDEGRTKDAAEKDEFDILKSEIKGIDEELSDLRELEQLNKAAARPVKTEVDAEPASTRSSRVVSVQRNLPKGFMFARYAICMANSRGIPGEAIRLAKEHYPDDIGVLRLVEKTAVAGGTTGGSHYLDDMVPYNVMQDFIEFLRPGSILGKFGGQVPGAAGRQYPSLNRVGFNERVSGMSTGYSAAWKGEGLPVLPSAAVTFNAALTWNCMSALAVLSKEAIRFSNPNAEMRVRDDLARAVNSKLDYDFVDPSKAASGTTSPASITYGVVATTPSGTGATNVRHDIAAMLELFAQNNLDPADIVLIMSATMATRISLMVNALGQPEFPSLTMVGGYLAGFPVIVSEHLTAVGSPSTQSIIAVKASDVYLADDGVVTVEASDQASIEMADTSSQNAGTGAGASSLVSLWQAGAVGLMANREITWKLRRSSAVQYISPAAYTVPTS